MTRPRPIPETPLLIGIIEILAIAALILIAFGILHPAHAASSDPTPVLVSAGGTAWDTWTANGPGWGAVIAANAGLQLFLARQHWLAQGRLLAALTGVGLVLVAVVNWHLGAAPSAGIMTAAMGAIALVVHPTVKGATTSTFRGPTTLGIVLLLGVCAGSCGSSQPSRANAISTIDTGLITARAAVRTYELDRARAIIETTPDKLARSAPLGELRAKVDRVIMALDAATYALDAARGVNDDTSIKGAQTALENALAAVAALTGGGQ